MGTHPIKVAVGLMTRVCCTHAQQRTAAMATQLYRLMHELEKRGLSAYAVQMVAEKGTTFSP